MRKVSEEDRLETWREQAIGEIDAAIIEARKRLARGHRRAEHGGRGELSGWRIRNLTRMAGRRAPVEDGMLPGRWWKVS